MPASATPVRRNVIFRGAVQGVGFRFTTRSLARAHAVTGFVRNLPDGTVELEVQGAADEVARFLDALATRFQDHIRSRQVTEKPPAADTGRFEITY